MLVIGQAAGFVFATQLHPLVPKTASNFFEFLRLSRAAKRADPPNAKFGVGTFILKMYCYNL
jgi:hypothetical protein